MALRELHHFEHFDEIRKRWVRARYVATKEEIARRHVKHRLVGAPELREVPDVPELGMGYSKPQD